MIRVLIVDDSAVVRKELQRLLSTDPEIDIVGAAPDAYAAKDLILSLRPDLITLDIEMPRMDGLTFLKKLMKHFPMPVLILSSHAQQGSRNAIEALNAGAIDIFNKPSRGESLAQQTAMLIEMIKIAAKVPKSMLLAKTATTRQRPPVPSSFPICKIIAIGASTGGTNAITSVLRQFPANAPATVMVQHMPANFTGPFAESLNRTCPMTVREAKRGDILRPGLALLAPGGFHLTLRRTGTRLVVDLETGPRVHFQRPAVDITFGSVADAAGGNAIGVLLTGMGCDGAAGMLSLKQAGGYTIAQDEATSVVYGMPRAAADLGAVDTVTGLFDIAEHTLNIAASNRRAA
jgi:two-component system, chemotaxis family, protein-glutamate methylesterase/glutaminase